jgi:hypothetical protein
MSELILALMVAPIVAFSFVFRVVSARRDGAIWLIGAIGVLVDLWLAGSTAGLFKRTTQPTVFIIVLLTVAIPSVFVLVFGIGLVGAKIASKIAGNGAKPARIGFAVGVLGFLSLWSDDVYKNWQAESVNTKDAATLSGVTAPQKMSPAPNWIPTPPAAAPAQADPLAELYKQATQGQVQPQPPQKSDPLADIYAQYKQSQQPQPTTQPESPRK